MKIPTQKGEHSCRYTELSLTKKEGILFMKLYTAAVRDLRTRMKEHNPGPKYFKGDNFPTVLVWFVMRKLSI